MRPVLLALLVACTTPPGASAPAPVVPTPGTLELTVSALVPGAPLTLTVEGAPTGRRVGFGASSREQPDGYCPASWGGSCVDLRRPTVLGSAVADASGRATLRVTAPANIAAPQISFQAVLLGAGGFDSSNVTTMFVLAREGDDDEDFLGNAEEIEVHGTDPLDEDSDDDHVPDGMEVTFTSSDPLDPADPPLIVAGEFQPGDLVFTELMPDPSAVPDADGEWFELANATSSWLLLDGLRLQDASGGGNDLAGPFVAPGGRLVYARSGDPVTNGGIEVNDVFSFSLNNTGAESVELLDGATVVARIAYDPSWPFDPGVSMGLGAQWSPDARDVAERAYWCSSDAWGGASTPGAANPDCPIALGYAWFSATILPRCTPCHLGGGSSGDRSWDTYASLFQSSVEVPTLHEIEPFDPDASYMLHKLNGTQASVGGSGVRMPASGNHFDDATLGLLRDWILLGAPEHED